MIAKMDSKATDKVIHKGVLAEIGEGCSGEADYSLADDDSDSRSHFSNMLDQDHLGEALDKLFETKLNEADSAYALPPGIRFNFETLGNGENSVEGDHFNLYQAAPSHVFLNQTRIQTHLPIQMQFPQLTNVNDWTLSLDDHHVPMDPQKRKREMSLNDDDNNVDDDEEEDEIEEGDDDYEEDDQHSSNSKKKRSYFRRSKHSQEVVEAYLEKKKVEKRERNRILAQQSRQRQKVEMNTLKARNAELEMAVCHLRKQLSICQAQLTNVYEQIGSYEEMAFQLTASNKQFCS